MRTNNNAVCFDSSGTEAAVAAALISSQRVRRGNFKPAAPYSSVCPSAKGARLAAAWSANLKENIVSAHRFIKIKSSLSALAFLLFVLHIAPILHGVLIKWDSFP